MTFSLLFQFLDLIKLSILNLTSSVIESYNHFETKERLSFTVSDIEKFYPSISKNLFIKAIQLAKQMTEVFDEDINLIMYAKKNLLFNEDIPWLEKDGNEDFNVQIGCFDGAEVCELVGSFILQQLSQLFEDQLVRLYRYDGLAIFKGLSGSETKRVKKKVIKYLKIVDLKSPLKQIFI